MHTRNNVMHLKQRSYTRREKKERKRDEKKGRGGEENA